MVKFCQANIRNQVESQQYTQEWVKSQIESENSSSAVPGKALKKSK